MDTTVSAKQVRVGDIIRGGYRLERFIARGGAGSVWLAKHTDNDRQAAVKVLDPDLTQDEQYIRRFVREARLVADIRHPNIVRIFSLKAIDKQFAIIMEYLDGPNLEQFLESTRMSALQAVHVTLQVLDALESVHAAGVVHRDLKPQNIIVLGTANSDLSMVPSIKLLDFGCAKDQSGDEVTQLGAIIGTPAYMAPEQVTGDPISAATDIYAVGEILYEMLTGKPVFAGKAAPNLLRKLDRQIPQIEIPRTIYQSQRFETIIEACLRSEPERRPTIERLMLVLQELRDVLLAHDESSTATLFHYEKRDGSVTTSSGIPIEDADIFDTIDTHVTYSDVTTLVYESRDEQEASVSRRIQERQSLSNVETIPVEDDLLISDSELNPADFDLVTDSQATKPSNLGMAEMHRLWWGTSGITVLSMIAISLGLLFG